MYGKERSNNMIGDIRKFRFWCQKVLPLVYDDSLSYYEVLCKIVQYLNKVIEDVNSIPEYIDAVIDEKLSDEHLQELIEQFVLNIEGAISSNNEGDNTNSSADYNVGQMLWWNGKLYRVIRQIDAGDTFIVDTNITLVNFEDLFNEFIDEVKHDISANDDGTSATATQSWTAGTWLWLNDKLYKVKSDITQGNAYVFSGDNANVEQITVEGAVHSNESAIADEVEARADADTALDGRVSDLENNVGDLNDLDTTDKTDLVSAINEVLANAGIYNKSTPNSGLTTNIGLKEGRYTVDSDLTINAQLVVPKGAIIEVANGVTLTINGQILAGRYQIFTGSGNVVVNSEYQPVGYPEWFGAVADDATDCTTAIQKCLDIFNVTELSIGIYRISSTLVMNKHNRQLKGVHRNMFSRPDFANCTVLNATTLNDIALRVGRDAYTSAGDNLSYPCVSNLAILFTESNNPNAVGLKCQYTFTAKIENVSVFNASKGFEIVGTVTTYFNHCTAWRDNSDAVYQRTGTSYGFFIDSTQNLGLAGGNASLYLTECTSTGYIGASTNAFVCFYVEGYVADIFFSRCESSGGHFGFQVIVAGPTIENNSDFKMDSCIVDGTYFTAIDIHSNDLSTRRQCMMDITNVWAANVSSANANGSVIQLAYVEGVTITGGSINALNNPRGVFLIHVKEIDICGLKITKGNQGLAIVDADHCTINYSARGSVYPLYLDSGSFLDVTENSIDGTAITIANVSIPQSAAGNMDDYVIDTIRLRAPISI